MNKFRSAVLLVLLVLSVFVRAANVTVVKVTPLLLAAQPSPSWNAGASMALTDVSAGNLTNTVMNTPGDYALCNQRITWANLVYSQSTHMWNGVLNPSSPFNSEFGLVVWVLIEFESKSGNDEISLDMIEMNFKSSDDVLNGTSGFVDASYTDLAFGIKANGTMIVSGSSSQKVAKIKLFARSKLFDGGATQAGLDQVRNWVAGQIQTAGDYTLTFTVQIVGDDSIKSSATVSVVGVPAPVTPRLKISREGVFIPNGEAGRTYQLFSQTQLQENPWQFEGIVNWTNVFDLQFTSGARFFRAKVQ